MTAEEKVEKSPNGSIRVSESRCMLSMHRLRLQKSLGAVQRRSKIGK